MTFRAFGKKRVVNSECQCSEQKPPKMTSFGSTDLRTSLLPPHRCLLHPPSVAQLLPRLAKHTVTIHKSSSLESFIVKKKIKKKENKTLVHTLRLLLFSLGASWLSPSFLFSALRAPPNLVPPGPRAAPVHRCPHLVVMAPCRTDTVSPQGLYTLFKWLQRSRYHPNLTRIVV